VSARYGWDEIAPSYEAIYREAVAARGAL